MLFGSRADLQSAEGAPLKDCESLLRLLTSLDDIQ